MKRINYSQIDVFLTVAAELNFRAAAAKLDVKPPSITQQLKQLEDELGVTLFNRTTRSVSLTQEGQQLYEKCKPARDQLENALEETYSQSNKPSGTLRITLSHIPLRLVMQPILKEFQQACPDIQIELSVDDGFVDIISEGFDAGIRLVEAVEKDMVAIPLTPPIHTVIVGSKDYLDKQGRPKNEEELAKHNAILYRHIAKKNIFRWRLQKDGKPFEVHMHGSLMVNDLDFMVQAAVQGMGLAYVFNTESQQLEEQGLLERVMEDYSLPLEGFSLYFPESNRSLGRLRAFIDFCKEKGLGRNYYPPRIKPNLKAI